MRQHRDGTSRLGATWFLAESEPTAKPTFARTSTRRMGARRAAPIVPLPQKVTSRKHARRVVTQYHEITKRIHDASSAADAARAAADLESIGNVDLPI